MGWEWGLGVIKSSNHPQLDVMRLAVHANLHRNWLIIFPKGRDIDCLQ